MTEYLFSSLKKSVITNSALVSFRYVVIAGIGLALSVGFAHFSTKQVFGQYQFILSAFALFSVFSLPGLNIAALRSVSQGKFGSVTQAVRLSFFCSMFAVPFLVGYGIYRMYVVDIESSTIGWVFIFFGLLFPFLNAPNTWYVHYEGRLMFLPVVIRTIFTSACMAALLFLSLWNQQSIFVLVSVWFFTNAVSGWFFYGEVRREELKSRNELHSLDIPYGLKVSAQKFFVGLTENIPVIAISFFLGFEAVANFQVASVFIGAVSGLLGALAAIALPVIFSNIASHHKNLLSYSVLSGILASIGYAVLVETLFLLAYGNRYQESFNLARLLIFLPLLVSTRMFLVNIFTARGENIRIISVYAVANVIAIVFFVTTFGEMSFASSAATYLYILNFSLLLPLAGYYFLSASRNTDSI